MPAASSFDSKLYAAVSSQNLQKSIIENGGIKVAGVFHVNLLHQTQENRNWNFIDKDLNTIYKIVGIYQSISQFIKFLNLMLRLIL